MVSTPCTNKSYIILGTVKPRYNEKLQRGPVLEQYVPPHFVDKIVTVAASVVTAHYIVNFSIELFSLTVLNGKHCSNKQAMLTSNIQ